MPRIAACNGGGRTRTNAFPAQVATAAAIPAVTLRASHIADYRQLFGRVALNLGATPDAVRSLPTGERLARYDRGEARPGA